MAKHEKVRTEDISLDNELNFEQFDFDNIDAQLSPDAKKPNSRSPVTEVFKGTVSGAVDKFKSPSFLARLTRNALPQEFGTIVDAADKAAGTASSLYDEAVKELKPQASRLAKKVDRLVPEERKTLKKITSKISAMFGDESISGSMSKEQLQDQGIATSLGQIFEQQQATQNELSARESARDDIKENIRRKEFDSSLGILTQISNNVGRMSSYQERVTQAVQKKSLELQYRSFFALTDMATTSKSYFEVFKAQNEAIAKNTALPEFVKIKNSERFKDLARTKFMDKIQNSFFGEGSAIDRGLKRITKDVKEYIKGVKQGLESASFGVDGLAQLKETNEILKEFGGEQISAAQLAGSALGGFVGDKIGDKAAEFARPQLDKVPGVKNALVTGANALTNLPGTINEIRKSDKAQEALKAEGLKGAAARGLDRLAGYFTDDRPDTKVNSPYGITSPMSAGVFNDKTQRSITDIIPGYLARILREITVLRTGDDKTGLVFYDQKSGKFVDKKAIGAMVKSSLSEKIKTSSYGFFAKSATENLLGEDNKVDQQTEAKVQDFIAKISSIPNMAFTPKNVKETNAYKQLDKDTKSLIDMLLDKKITSAESPRSGQLDFTKNIMDVQSATPDARGVIEALIHAGYGEVLEEQGLVSRDQQGNFDIDLEKYFALVREEGLAKPGEKGEVDANAKKYFDAVDKERGTKRKAARAKSKPGQIKPDEDEITSDRNKKTNVKKAPKPGSRTRGGKKLPAQLVKSDEDAKEDIHPLHPKRALNAIRKTGVFDWFYKPGEGDDQPHRGPMAQDVQKNMGSGTAPGGKKIDLTSMNGNNMAAIQELADQQDGIVNKVKKLFTKKDETKDDTMKVVKGIATDVKALRKLVETGKGGFGGGSGRGKGRAGPTGDKYKGEDTYQDILGNVWTASGALVKRAASDAKATAIKGYEQGRDKIVKPGVDKVKELYDRYKDPVKDKLLQARDKGVEMLKTGYESGKDYIDNKLPVHVAKAKELFSDAKAAIKNSLYAVHDVYIKGRNKPVIKAMLLSAGEYYDSATGKVLKTMDDLAKAKGDIVDKAGNIVLSLEDAANGMYDQYGGKLKTGLERLSAKAKDLGKKAVDRVKAFWGTLLAQGKEIGGKLMDKWLPQIKDFFQNFGMFGNRRVYDVLVEIRDLMRGENPPKHEDKKKSQQTPTGDKGDKSTSLKDKAMNLANKAKSKASGVVDRVKGLFGQKPLEAKKTAVGKALAKKRAKAKQAEDGDVETTTTVEETSADSGPQLQQPQAKYTSDGSLLEGIKSFGFKLPGMLSGAKDKIGSIGQAMKGATGVKGKAGAAFEAAKGLFTEEEPQKPSRRKPKEKKTVVGRALAQKRTDEKKAAAEAAAKAKKDRLEAAAKAKAAKVKTTKAKTSVKPVVKPQGKLAKLSAGVRGKAGLALGAISGFFNKEGDPEKKSSGQKADRRQNAQAQPQDNAPAAVPKKTTTTKRRGKGKAAYNDRDSSGRRDGAWEDRLEAQAAADAERRAKAPGLQQAEAKYTSDKSIIDSIMEKVSGVFSFLTSGAGRLFGAAGSVISGVGTVASMAGGLIGKAFTGAKAVLGLGGKAAGAAGKGLAAVGRPIAGAAASAGRVGMVANVVSKVGMVRNIALAGSLMTGGVGSAILGAVGVGISAIGSILASPVVLGAAALAAVGYGAYKAFKYITRDDVDSLEQIRMHQYGLTKGDKSYNHYLLSLEEYLLEGRVGFNDGQAVLMDKKIDPEQLLNIFSIDKNDGPAASKLAQWFDARFKPFFLTNCTALFSVNKKVSLKNANKELTAAEKVKFYGLISFESGPYNVLVSPFKDLAQLSDTKSVTQALIATCTAFDKKKAEAEAKTSKDKAEKKALADKEKADKAAKAVAGVTAVSNMLDPQKKAEATKKAEADKKADEGKKLVAEVVKSNAGRDKVAPIKDESQAAQDGPLQEKPATGEKGPVDKTINEGPTAASGPLKVADGPVRDGSQAMQYMKLGPNVKLDGMNPAMKQQLLAMVQEYGERTGKSVTVNAAVRDSAEQERLWRQNPKKAARPGTSLHEFGLAIDMNSGDLDAMDQAGLMRKYGFTRPVGGEPWHAEAAGIQTNIKMAKNDPSFASQAIGASLNKGGGGVGSIRGTPLGKRDTMFAVAQMGLTAQKVTDKAMAETDKDKVTNLAGGSPLKPTVAEAPPAPKPVTAIAAAAPAVVKTPVQMAANDPGKGEAKPATVQTAYQQSDKYNAAAKMPDMEVKPKEATTGVDTKSSGPYAEVKDRVTKVARQEGVPPQELLTFAATESGLNPNARAPQGTSAGLFGFNKTSWGHQVQQVGSRMGPNPQPTNIDDATIAASDYYKTNKKFISSVKPNPNMTDVYLAHFLGPTGSRKFLSADPNEIAANILPNAAAANRSYFYEGNRPLTVGEVYRKIDQRLAKKAQEFGINYQGGGDLTSKPSAQRAAGGDAPPVSVKDATGGQPPAPTDQAIPRPSREAAPMVRSPMPMAQGRVAPVVQTAAVGPDTVSRPQAMGSSSQVSASMADTMTKQLDVQTQMLSVLQKIMASTETTAQAVTKAATQQPQTQQPAAKPAQQQASFQQINSAVDLTRKSA